MKFMETVTSPMSNYQFFLALHPCNYVIKKGTVLLGLCPSKFSDPCRSSWLNYHLSFITIFALAT